MSPTASTSWLSGVETALASDTCCFFVVVLIELRKVDDVDPGRNGVDDRWIVEGGAALGVIERWSLGGVIASRYPFGVLVVG